MRILLIKSRGSLEETNITGIYHPLGLAYIASVLRDAGHEVFFLDNQIECLRDIALKGEIRKIGPDVVLLSATTPLWPVLIKLSNLIKKVSPKIIIGVGGPHLSIYPEESLSHEGFDFGVYGEGEETILEISRAIEGGMALEKIKGCIFRKNGEVTVNPPRDVIDPLDSIPFPAIDLMPYRKYSAFSVRRPFFSMVTSRGCPYNCRFCFRGSLGHYRARSPENVAEEMEILVNKYKIKDIIIFDETFAVEEERVMRICELICSKRLKFKWDIRTRVDLLKERVLRALKIAGCSRLHIGIESGEQEILCRMNKGFSLSDIRDKVRLAKKAGLELRGYFMLAYPGETYESIDRTIEFSRSLPLDWASYTVTIGLPGTDLYKEALEKGYFDIDYWKECTKGNFPGPRPYFIPKGLKEKDLLALKRKAYLKFYMRPRAIFNLIKASRLFGTVGNLRLLSSIYYSTTKI